MWPGRFCSAPPVVADSTTLSDPLKKELSMRNRYGTALALLLLACIESDATPARSSQTPRGRLHPTLLARAQEAKSQAPEQLLPAATQIYLRWDGTKAHRAAYDQTALGKMMKGDTGKFFSGVFGLLSETVVSTLTTQGLLEGKRPEELQRLQKDSAEAGKLLGLLGDQGFVLAIEGRSVLPPSAQVTLIVPGAGAKPGPLFGTLRLVTSLAKVPVKEVKADGHTYSVIEAGPASLGWWIEGQHAVVVATTDSIPEAAKRMRSGDHLRLPSNSLYKQLTGFKEFETSARAFLDTQALAKLARSSHKEAGPLIKEIGLDGLQSVVFYSGFQGDAERSLTEISTAGERRGLLNLLSGKPFTLKDVPKLPPDVFSWSMSTFDPGVWHDTAVHSVEAVIRLASPDQLPQMKQFLKQVDQALGINLRKDLLASIGPQLVQYSSPSEGIFSLSQTVMIKVRDRAKLEETLDKMIHALGTQFGKEVTITRKKYHGVDVHEVYVAAQGFILVPTYAIHGDWLVMSYYPQPVQGYILRATGELPAWKPGEHVKKSLGMMPKEMLSISVTDPRPSIRQLLTFAPLIAGTVRSFTETKIDVGSLPNAQEATQHLFPNVTVTEDTGNKIRIHTRASLALPIDVGSPLDAYVFAAAAAGLFSVGR
jgi:hypothetical protein